MFAGQLAGQGVQLEARLGYLASTPLLEDELTTDTALLRLYGNRLGERPRALSAPAPVLSAGVRLNLRRGVSVAALAGFQPTQLRVEGGEGTRDVESISVLHALLEGTVRGRGPLLVSAGFGVLGYRAEDRGIFAGGADVSPLLRGGAGGAVTVGRHLVTLRGVGELHRFGSNPVRAVGGKSARVGRYGIEGAFTWGGAR